MGKPSIFSKEYEKKMRKRKRNTLISLLILVGITAIIVLKFTYYPINFKHIRQNIQAWIDSDPKLDGDEKFSSEKSETESSKEYDIEDEKIDKKDIGQDEYLDVNLVSGKVVKAIIKTDKSGNKLFENVEQLDNGVTFDISKSKKQLLILDTDLQIKIYNIDGSSKVVSKDKYISTKGIVFAKEAVLGSQPDYAWNVNPKFLNEENIIFVTSRPYFGTSATKKYLWITNIVDGSDKVCWESKGSDIEIKTREEKGVKIIIDGVEKYINEDGNLVS